MTISALYPRLIEVRRVKTVAGATDAIGLTGYSGAEQSTSSAAGESILYSDIPASIQAGPSGRKKDNALPQDVVYAPTWNIFIPKLALPKASVRDRDIIVDDEFYRYEIGQAYWNLLGMKLICIRLES